MPYDGFSLICSTSTRLILLPRPVARIDDLSIRERGFLLVGGITVLYFIWNAMLMQPLDLKRRQAQADLLNRGAELQELNTRMLEMQTQARDDPNIALKKELDALRQQLEEVESELGATTAHLIEPGQMAVVLQQVLQQTSGLELKSLSSLGSSPLVAAKAAGKPAAGKKAVSAGSAEVAPVFKHGLRIEFAGDFFETLQYLRDLESLDWKFFWDSIEFKVGDYPRANSAVTVYAISLADKWIGN